jgi:hypothetical protein
MSREESKTYHFKKVSCHLLVTSELSEKIINCNYNICAINYLLSETQPLFTISLLVPGYNSSLEYHFSLSV